MNSRINGVALLSKNVGFTSFESLSVLKRNLNTSKVGHAGTLDKFAEGLLLVLVGSFTRLNALTTDLDKEYLATFCLGQTTSTLDPESSISGVGRVPSLNEIEKVLPSFKGKIWQVPPQYSAVHVKGKRAYERALKGEQFQIPARLVTIYNLEILCYEKNFLSLRICCSKGTYVRSLARDLGFALGTVGFVSQLRREKIGPFAWASALPADLIDQSTLMSASVFLSSLGIAFHMVSDPLPFMRGQNLQIALERQHINCQEDAPLALLTQEGELLALIRKQANHYSYVFSTSSF